MRHMLFGASVLVGCAGASPPVAEQAAPPPSPSEEVREHDASRGDAAVEATPSEEDPAASETPLDPKVIQGVVRAAFVDLRSCYEAVLVNDPNAHGRVEVRFVIAADGHVSAATATTDEALSDEVEPCVERVFGTLTFPRPPHEFTVSYPIAFSPKEWGAAR